jgi:glycerol-3-phosphate dehydrogenase (NAD(P)+)
MNCVVIGAGSFGTSIAQVLTKNSLNSVSIISRDLNLVNQINNSNRNEKYHSGFPLNPSIKCFQNISEISDVDIVFLATPAKTIEYIYKEISPLLSHSTIFVNLAKGLTESGMPICTAIKSDKLVSMKGPSFANDVIFDFPTGFTLASSSIENAKIVSSLFAGSKMVFDFSKDPDGVEYLSVLKNIYAIIIGIVSGKSNSANMEFLVLAKAVKEMKTFLDEFNCEHDTVFNFCGLGDLCLTGLTDLSRNRTLGLLIGKGFLSGNHQSSVVTEGLRSIDIILNKVKNVPESNLKFGMVVSLKKLISHEIELSDFIKEVTK